MKDLLNYKGFLGSVEISVKDNCLHGKVLFINDLVTYEAQTPSELKSEFKSAVEDYLDTCSKLGRSPDKPFSGSFNIRVGRELHQKLARYAAMKQTSINDVVKKALIECLAEPESREAS